MAAETPRGPLAWMARHPVAANLLMFVVLVGGLLGLMRVKQEVFPEFELDVVMVTVPYPGATPADVEQGIVLAVEEAVRGVDGVKYVRSTAAEGVGNVSVELLAGADADKVLADIKSEVDRITSFPGDAEEPQVSLLAGRQQVVSLVIAGDQELATLHDIAERAREELLASGGVTQIDIGGVPALELAIEIPRERLEALGLTLDEVAAQIGFASMELPGGEIETRGGEILVRVSDRLLTVDEFADMRLRSTLQGAEVRLGDVAEIRDGYADEDKAQFYDGRPAVRLTAYRVGDETPTGVAAAVRAYADDLDARLPDGVDVAIWNDDSESLADRIDLLVRNARMGLVLVIGVLALFLNLRLAFWVALGIPVSFMGAFLLMPGFDVSVNMISLFGLIVTLGMVVDDAIVVGEAFHTRMQKGMRPMRAAIEGAREVATPVTFAILTTVAAFAPMFFVPGVMGKVFRILPAVVIAVLIFSLVESFFILPAHLGHARNRPPGRVRAALDRVQGRVAGGLERFVEGPYRRALEATLRQRYVAIAAGVGMIVVSIAMVASGLVPREFFPKIQGDVVTAAARLPYGAPSERTLAVRDALERASVQAVGAVGEPDIVRGTYTRVGEGPAGGHSLAGPATGGHLVTVEVQLVPSDAREVSSAAFAAAWADSLPPLAGLESLTFSSAVGPGSGAAVEVQLSHRDTDVLAAASEEVAEAMRSYTQLTDVENGYASGKPQLDFTLLPSARGLGLTTNEVARQIRGAFYGAEALREQRGRNELKVMVRLPEEQRRSEFDLEQLRIRLPGGGYVPLSQVADFDRSRSPTEIRREDGRRIVTVSAELAPGVRSSADVVEALSADDLPALERRFPGLEATFVGAQRDQAESFAALGQNYLFALFVIYALLAIPTRSYTKPLVIMSAIPFGIVGAVWGHFLMQYEMSLISMFGLIALSGVVVNDSLVLVDAANRRQAEGAGVWDAVVYAGTRRFRPILLTSLTTFFGLMPMIFETSLQARFLIPMAISLGFGVLFVTVIVLLLVPCLFLVSEDAVAAVGRVWDALFGAREPEDDEVPAPLDEQRGASAK